MPQENPGQAQRVAHGTKITGSAGIHGRHVHRAQPEARLLRREQEFGLELVPGRESIEMLVVEKVK